MKKENKLEEAARSDLHRISNLDLIISQSVRPAEQHPSRRPIAQKSPFVVKSIIIAAAVVVVVA